MDRKKLELKPNEKIILELLFDNPIEGESQYGKYFMYGLMHLSGIFLLLKNGVKKPVTTGYHTGKMRNRNWFIL